MVNKKGNHPQMAQQLIQVMVTMAGWWYTYPLKNHGVKVSRDDFSIPN